MRSHRFRTSLYAACLSVAAFACSGGKVAAPLDYADPSRWAALPWVPNPSMRVPDPALENRQDRAEADVFYVYPTVFDAFFTDNAAVDDEEYRQRVASLLASQASCLNAVGRIYAPYYRQASLWVYVGSEATQRRAFDTAYADVEAAFLHYMEHWNRGRPLFLLAHTQGSQMAVRLLQEHFRDLHLERVLVAAYLVGERIGERTFDDLPPCASPDQTGCFVTWATVAAGGETRLLTGTPVGPPVCVNPLTWTLDETPAPADRHLGGVPAGSDGVRRHLVSATCRDGLLHVSPPPAGFAHDGPDYHESDIDLFYLDLRENARVRLARFLADRAARRRDG